MPLLLEAHAVYIWVCICKGWIFRGGRLFSILIEMKQAAGRQMCWAFAMGLLRRTKNTLGLGREAVALLLSDFSRQRSLHIQANVWYRITSEVSWAGPFLSFIQRWQQSLKVSSNLENVLCLWTSLRRITARQRASKCRWPGLRVLPTTSVRKTYVRQPGILLNSVSLL